MKLMSICSARPNFVKLAAVHHAFAALKQPGDKHVIVHTGQHYDPLFSDIFFEQLKIPKPDENLGVHGGTREETIENTTKELLPQLEKHKPDLLVVYGDVNGALGAALAAQQLGIKLAHVEAGLRSFDMTMPEEVNRIGIDKIADLLFVSEQAGVNNLHKEKAHGKILLAGNTMIDTLVRMMPLIDKQKLPAGVPDRFGIVTLHRPSNVDTAESLKSNLKFLAEISEYLPLILPLHHRTRTSLEKFGLRNAVPRGVHIIEPMGYIPFLALVKESAFVLTDSGGIQEEATFLHKRCFTLRRNTERPSTVESGSNQLIDPEKPSDCAQVVAFARHPRAPMVRIPPLWDGKAGERILLTMRRFLSPA